MDVRCQNCGHPLHLKPAPDSREVTCSSCGVAMVLPAAAKNGSANRVRHFIEPRPTEKSFDRIFDPIPRWILYTVGLVLALGLLAPFWLYLVSERTGRKQMILSEETAAMVPPPSTNAVVSSPMLTERPVGSSLLDQFLGLRLDSSREIVQKRFNLALRNTRGMEPEIYEMNQDGDLLHISAQFYNHLLKEFSIVARERRQGAEQAEKELTDQFGEPHQRNDGQNTPQPGMTGLTLSDLSGAPAPDEWRRKLNQFPLRRDLVWFDNENRVEASIFYTAADPILCTSMMSVHVTATAWLKTKRPGFGATDPGLNAPPARGGDAPKRLFP